MVLVDSVGSTVMKVVTLLWAAEIDVVSSLRVSELDVAASLWVAELLLTARIPVMVGVCLVVFVMANGVVKLVPAVELFVLLEISADVWTRVSLMLYVGPVVGVPVVIVVMSTVLSVVVNFSKARSMVVRFVTVVVFVVVSDDSTVVSVEVAPRIVVELVEAEVVGAEAGMEAVVMLMLVVVAVEVVPLDMVLDLVVVVANSLLGRVEFVRTWQGDSQHNLISYS